MATESIKKPETKDEQIERLERVNRTNNITIGLLVIAVVATHALQYRVNKQINKTRSM